MLVVGNWDANNDLIQWPYNKAGTVCATMQNGVCIDAQRLAKDFSSMANGKPQLLALLLMVVTLLCRAQAWRRPLLLVLLQCYTLMHHMKGKHLVQLVLVTGDKNITGYNENVHGLAYWTWMPNTPWCNRFAPQQDAQMVVLVQ